MRINLIAGVDHRIKMLVFLCVKNVWKFIRGAVMKKSKEIFADNYISCCPTCGSPVVVKGKTTKYYVPVNKQVLEELGFRLNSEGNNEVSM